MLKNRRARGSIIEKPHDRSQNTDKHNRNNKKVFRPRCKVRLPVLARHSSTLSGTPNGQRYVRGISRRVVWDTQQRWGEPVANRTGGDDKAIRAALHQVWPPVAIGLALAINLAWIAALAYGIYTLF